MEDKKSRKKELINYFLNKNILINPEILENEIDLTSMKEIIENKESSTLLVLNKDFEKILTKNKEKLEELNWLDLERIRALAEKRKGKNIYDKFLIHLTEPLQEPQYQEIENKVKIVFSYNKKLKPIEPQDFVSYFTNRFNSIKKILQNRQELQNPVSINRIFSKKDKEQVSIIGMVKLKETTKSGGISFIIEDLTGSIKVFVNKNRKEIFDVAKDTVLDQVLGVVGVTGTNIVFANNIIEPDIPINKELRKSQDEVYSLFLSDLHIGSTLFLRDKFEKFLNWLNGESEKHRELISKIRYLFIAGDLVDGCSIYPGQERELEILDIYEQYKECAKLLARIPKHINIIISPGNHDAMRISEPQPEFYKDFAEDLWKLSNITIISNPGVVNIEANNNFSGFDVLIYHGYSFDYYIANVESIRNNGGYDRPDLIMKFILQKRHLAPTYSSTLSLPDPEKDYLVIEKVPDIFVTGHLHRVSAKNYRHVTMICGSCWQDMTPFQEKLGHNPEPCRVPMLNLQTREIKILRF